MTKEVKGGSANYIYMNEEKKYYVPEIEEFHIGFEFEVKSSSNNWLHTECHSGWISDASSDFEEEEESSEDKPYSENYRVKYLDQEDIESLGATFIKKNRDIVFLFEKTVEDHRKRGKTLIQIGHNNIFDWVVVSAFHEKNGGFIDSNEVVMFSGTIKNKSELKKLLIQLGIHE